MNTDIILQNGTLLDLAQKIESTIATRDMPRWEENLRNHERTLSILDEVQKSILSINISLANLSSSIETTNANTKKLEDKVNSTIKNNNNKTLSWSQIYFTGAISLTGALLAIFGYAHFIH